ncbi:Uncharacterised protein [Mycobacteroides abscessus]|nr:Uncharacterised protein [Mycobacteroides abscessus]
MWSPRRRISPSSAIRAPQPGSCSPTVPIFVFPGRLTLVGAVDSVRP